MKKTYFMIIAFFLYFQGIAQVLNEPADWPNPAWVITGNYSNTISTFESNPLTTASFAFDDDDAENGHEDNIAAESPIIDLTATHAAGENSIEVSVMYGYRKNSTVEILRFEYWNADISAWVSWQNILGNDLDVTDNFCGITKTNFVTDPLNIVSFTPTQLSGFKYRIFFDDDPSGPGWQYGFCFNSPTIKSLACASPALVTASNVSEAGADITWQGSAAGYEYVLNNTATEPTVSGTSINTTFYSPASLTDNTTYYFHVRSTCTGGIISEWKTISFLTLPSPASNDECSSAIALPVNPDFNCGTIISGTLSGATASAEPDNGAGTPDDDVWYTFVATSTTHKISLLNISGTPTDLVHEVLEGTCGGGLTSLEISDDNTSTVQNLTIGNTYYLRIFSYATATPNETTIFNVCIGTPPPPPANDDCANAIGLTVNPDFSCGTVTPGDLTSATDSGEPDNGAGTPNDDVWYTFVATSTTHKINLLNVTGTPTDLVHEVLEGTCGGGLTSLNISDDNTSTVSNLIVGNTYYVRVFSYVSDSGATSKFNICVGTPPAPPINDDCVNAITLTINPDASCAVTTSGTLLSATDSGEPDNGAGTPNDDVWYTFVATSTSQTVSLSNVAGSTTDLVHEILEGTCGGGLTSINISDSNTSLTSGLVIGNTYYVRVFSYSSNFGADTTFNLCVGTPPPPPANDDCVNAVALTVNPDFLCGTVTPGDLTSATDSGEPDNGAGTPNDDVWYTFVATSTSHKISLLNVTGIPTDLVHEVLKGTCGGGLTSLNVSNDDTSTVTDLVVGNTYYVRVFSYVSDSGATSKFNICVGTPPAPPINDDCVNAIALTVNPDASCAVTTSGTLLSATDSGEPDNGAGTPNDDVWYTFVATSTSQTVSLSNVAGSPTDLVHEILEGTCGGGLTSLNISDNDTSLTSGLVIGNTYYVRVFSYSSSTGVTTTFTVCVGTPPPAPLNDDCANAVALTVNPDFLCGTVTPGDLTSATDSGEPDNGAGTPNDDVWYTFVATSTSHKISLLNITGAPTDLVHEVLEGTCGGGLTSLNVSDDDTSTVTDLVVGNTYYVRVFSYSSATGATSKFNVCVGTPAAAPVNDDCANAIVITSFPFDQSVDASGATNNDGFITACSENEMNDGVWYTVVGNGGDIQVTIDPTGWDPQLGIYTGLCGAYTCVSTIDSGGLGDNETLTITASEIGTTYYINVGYYSGTTDSPEGQFAINVTSTVMGVGNNDLNNFKAYPNPVKDILNLSYTQNITNVAVFNLLGQQVISKAMNANKDQIDMSDLSAGTYLVKVTCDKKVQTIKVVKQ